MNNLIILFFMLAINLMVISESIDETNSIPHTLQMKNSLYSEKLVREFLLTVRSGKDPDRARDYMADKVLAHQMNAENPQTMERSPQNYADHVKEFLKIYGRFIFEITELIAQDNKVYARWKQTGTHLTTIDGYRATGQPLVEIASAVYRVENGKIAEYWIQIDRLGLDEQLRQQASK